MYPCCTNGKNQTIDIISTTPAAIPTEAKMPKAPKMLASSMRIGILRRLAAVVFIKTNLAVRLAIKTWFRSVVITCAMVNNINEAIKMGCWRMKRRAGDQIPSPTKKIRAAIAEVMPPIVKVELIIELAEAPCLILTSGAMGKLPKTQPV